MAKAEICHCNYRQRVAIMKRIAEIISWLALGITLVPACLFFVDKLIDMGAQIILCDPHRATVIGQNKMICRTIPPSLLLWKAPYRWEH